MHFFQGKQLVFPMKFLQKTAIVLLFVTLFFSYPFSDKATAQWSAGLSYELRNEEPKHGAGIRIDREIMTFSPLIDLGVRGHFSYFSDEVNLRQGEFEYTGNYNTYDVGISGLLLFNIGLLRPYIGAGLGLDNSSLDGTDIHQSGNENGSNEKGFFSNVQNEPGPTETSVIMFSWDSVDAYFMTTVGASVEVLPFLAPFIEFRYTEVSGRDDFGYQNYSRVSAGLTVRF